VWGGCNEEETDWEKQRKERKQSKKQRNERRDTRQKTKENKRNRSGETDMRDIYPCAAVVVVYLFVTKWLGLGYALFNNPSLFVRLSGEVVALVVPCY
jgi:hypothetical protein